jgi:hypothetical protein
VVVKCEKWTETARLPLCESLAYADGISGFFVGVEAGAVPLEKARPYIEVHSCTKGAINAGVYNKKR